MCITWVQNVVAKEGLYISVLPSHINSYLSSVHKKQSAIMDNKEKEAREKLGGEVKLGHCLDVILKNADVALHYPSFVKLYDQLVAGILLNKGAIVSATIYIYILISTSPLYIINILNQNICFLFFLRRSTSLIRS